MAEETEVQESLYEFDLHANTKTRTWMDQSFFETVIRSFLKDQEVKVNSFELKPGAKPGDNFASVIYKCKLNYSTKNEIEKDLLMVIKTLPETSANKKAFIENSPLFKTEMDMYGEVLPDIFELWKSVGENSMLCPKLIYQSISPNPVVILEDISPYGYVMIDKPTEDYEVSKMIVQRLAKFHAANFYLCNEGNRDYSNFDQCLFKFMDPEILDSMFTHNFKFLLEEMRSWEGFEQYLPSYEASINSLRDILLKVYEPNKNYNVLNHGDHHNKNLLFKIEDEKVKDICILDYQICVYASPAIDLTYALYFDLSFENRQKHRADFIKYYHDEFVKALKSYGYLKKPPSLLDLNIEILKCGALEALIAICFLPFMFIDWNVITPEDFLPQNIMIFRKKCYASPECKRILEKELPRMFQHGYM